MSNPRRVMATWDSGPDFVYGDHWIGPTHVSLFDGAQRKLINTIEVQLPHESAGEKGSYSVPFFVPKYSPWYVPNPDKSGKGKPLLLHLRDLTGEGISGQFTLFDYVASGIENGSVWGYSVRSDMAVHYPVEVLQGKFSPVVQYWIPQVFSTEPSGAAHWKFTWEPAHGADAWVDEDVRFDARRQLFVEKKRIRPYPGSSQFYCEVETKAVPAFLSRTAPGLTSEDIQGVQGLIDATPDHTLSATGLVASFHGHDIRLELEWLPADRTRISIELTTETDFAETLRSEIRAWCKPD